MCVCIPAPGAIPLPRRHRRVPQRLVQPSGRVDSRSAAAYIYLYLYNYTSKYLYLSISIYVPAPVTNRHPRRHRRVPQRLVRPSGRVDSRSAAAPCAGWAKGAAALGRSQRRREVCHGEREGGPAVVPLAGPPVLRE